MSNRPRPRVEGAGCARQELGIVCWRRSATLVVSQVEKFYDALLKTGEIPKDCKAGLRYRHESFRPSVPRCLLAERKVLVSAASRMPE